jgi:hypothetical protein
MIHFPLINNFFPQKINVAKMHSNIFHPDSYQRHFYNRYIYILGYLSLTRKTRILQHVTEINEKTSNSALQKS